jgi:hypothetical protein
MVSYVSEISMILLPQDPRHRRFTSKSFYEWFGLPLSGLESRRCLRTNMYQVFVERKPCEQDAVAARSEVPREEPRALQPTKQSQGQNPPTQEKKTNGRGSKRIPVSPPLATKRSTSTYYLRSSSDFTLQYNTVQYNTTIQLSTKWQLRMRKT